MYKHIYFIGIGGIGMSAIARYYNAKGFKVSGYDKTPSPLTEALEQEGIDVHYEDNIDFVPKSVEDTLVVYTPAIPKDMGELVYVQEKGYRVIKRSRMLGEIAEGQRCMAVAGTHGKTTTSTLAAHIFQDSGEGCSAFLGGISKNYDTNLLVSRNETIVAEADEFDRSFLQLYPEISVITSMDADHLDIYGDEAHIREAFKAYASQVSGTVIVKHGLDITPADTVDFISEKDNFSAAGSQIKEIIDSAGITYNSFSYTILEGRDITEPLTNLMTATGTNRVLIASESEAFVNDVVRNLNILIYNKLNVVLYAPARIRNFETIEVENLHNTSLHASLGYLIDYESDQVKNFLLKYRALYNTEPTQYAFQGYDIATYFISMCSRYGSDWMKKLAESEKEMLQSSFRFTPIEEGGYVNRGIRRLVYGPGWSVTKTR